MHDARLDHERRRGLRPDWERWLRPDWERCVQPAQVEAMRRECAARRAAFEPPRALRLREEASKVDEQKQWKAEVAERKLRCDLAWARFTRTLARYLAQQRTARKYSPDQPRVPTGRPGGGQWTSGGAADGTDQQLSTDPAATRVAQYSMGTLVGQSRIRGGGWMCFYKFSFGTIMAPGTTNLGCSLWVTAAGVSHGKLIANDN